VPKNRPAIGDLMTMFNFKDPHFGTSKLPGHRQPRALPLSQLPLITNSER
jgi:phospholipase C